MFVLICFGTIGIDFWVYDEAKLPQESTLNSMFSMNGMFHGTIDSRGTDKRRLPQK